MNSNNISSNISPLEMMELNNEDAKQIDVALGAIINDVPSKIASIKSKLDEIETKIKSLKTRNLNFNINSEIANLAKNYDVFSQDVLNYASYYELQIINIINIFDKMNSLDGSLTIDNNFFKNLPFLGTTLFTLLNYFGNGNPVDDFPQLALDVTGNVLDSDFKESLGNLIYNATEYFTNMMNLNFITANGIAGAGLIAVESLYDLLFENTNNAKQMPITLGNAVGDSFKLVAGNTIVKYAAVPVADTVSTLVTTKLAGLTIAPKIGAAAGGAVGAGIVILGEITINHIVDPLVADATGEAFIYGTSIPENGGASSLYSDYLNAIDTNTYTYGSIGRTTSLYGMTVSSEYCHELLQLDPVGTLYGLDDFSYVEGSAWDKALNDYIVKLDSIPKDSIDIKEQVEQITADALIGSDGSGFDADYIRDLIIDKGFDPYDYAINS